CSSDLRAEEPLALLRWNAGPRVLDRDLYRPVLLRELELDAPAVRRRAERVREQVVDDLQHPVAVGDDHRVRAHVDAVVDRALARLVGERLVRALDELLHVHLFAKDGEPVRVELRECEVCSGSSTTPARSAATWPRIAVSGVRSSCETDIRKLRSRVSVSASRSA